MEMDKMTAWLYSPNVKPAKELSAHDQRMIQLGWDAHRTLPPQPDQKTKEEKLEELGDSRWRLWTCPKCDGKGKINYGEYLYG